MRLTEAVAKMRLKSIANGECAGIAVKIYEKGFIKESKGSKKKGSVEENLKMHVESYGSFIARADLLALIKNSDVKREAEEMIEILNCRGVILMSVGGKYKIAIK
ncbi:hypothetical protein ENBRE01_3493 [Enteropsectra breve]|nr:hypothetical protein ENBRE01_3493 [Enteropsectra breve]